MKFTCELCGGSNIERNDEGFVCTDCGCKYSMEQARKIFSDIKGTTNNSQLTQYLEIAQSALDSKNGQEAYSYAEKVLERDSSCSTAWYIKMCSIEFIAKIGNPKVEEVVSCSRQVVRTCKENGNTEMIEKTYTYLLNRASDLLSIATNLAIDTTMIENLTQSVMRVNPSNVTAQVISSDATTLGMMEALANGALSLKKEVPVEEIKSSNKYIELVQRAANGYITYCNSYVNRVTIYSAYLNDANLAERRMKISEFKQGLPTEISSNIPDSIDSGKEKAESNNGCYIATCVYGSYDCPQVWTLRRYRDYTLAETWYGKAFIKTYYAISPTIVKWFGNTNWFKSFWKNKLDQMIIKLQDKGIEDTPYKDRNW